MLDRRVCLTVVAGVVLLYCGRGGGRVCRYDPLTGAVLLTLTVGGGHVSRVSSCTFGGRDLTDLFITTAAPDEPFDYAKEPLAGSVFVARNVGVRGTLSTPFKGATHSSGSQQ